MGYDGIREITARRLIDAELHAYHDTKRAIEDRTRDIIAGGYGVDPVRERVKFGDVWDPTGFRASLLADDLRLRELRRIVGAIDTALAALPEIYARLVRVYYWSPRSAAEAAAELGLSLATFYRYRRGVQNAIAGRLGWLDEAAV